MAGDWSTIQQLADGYQSRPTLIALHIMSEENGFWRTRKRARNRQVSAVLLIEELMPWSVARKTPMLWHNPWAERPLDPNIWQGPQMIPNMDVPEPYMQERFGKKGHEIFHMQTDVGGLSL